MEYVCSPLGFDPSSHIDEELPAPPRYSGHGAARIFAAKIRVDDVEECGAGTVWLGEWMGRWPVVKSGS